MNTQTNHPQNTSPFNPGNLTRIIVGLAMLSMGVVFLAGQTGWFELPFTFNWWAFYLLIPAVGFAFAAVHLYRKSGRRLTAGVLTQGILAVGMTAFAVTLMFGIYLPINWGAIWPLFIIAIGLSILFAKQG